jgi:phosphoenolpyruvate mutase
MNNSKYNKSKKNVYFAFSGDNLNSAHINLLIKSNKLGNVIVGLLTDKAINEYKDIPLLKYSQREITIKNLKFINKVVPQEEASYKKNIRRYKPDYVVHGDDWKKGVLKKYRDEVLKELSKYGGKLVEYPYTKNIKYENLGTKRNIHELISGRTSYLNRLLKTKNYLRVIESHTPLIAKMIDNLKVKKEKNYNEFDALWSSSLTDSLIRGKPDNQAVELTTRIEALSETVEVSKKPIIFDADNGGDLHLLKFKIRAMENIGISAICIEDKVGVKVNSLDTDQSKTRQSSITDFQKKIKEIKNSRTTEDFLIIARVESLILGKGQKDALKRAEAYSKAGADAILIHSKNKNADEIIEFSKRFKKSKFCKPLVCVPSTYSKTYEKKLINNDFKIIIYANQLLRASYKVILQTAASILKNERSFEIEKKIIPIKEIIKLGEK